MKYRFLRILSLLMAAFLVLFIPVSTSTPYDVTQPEECILNFTVLSDVHIEGNRFERCRIYGKCLQDIKKNKSGNDALVFLGDNVMCGQNIESMLFYAITGIYNPADNYINCQGNHDIGNGEGDYNTMFNRFAGYSKAFFNLDIDKPYYCRVIKGCYFVVLGTETQTVHSCDMGEVQVDWLEKIVKSAERTDSCVFVFNHYDYDYVEGGEYDRLVSVLSGYDKLYYFHGHNHADMRIWNFDCYDGIKQINVSNLTDLPDEGNYSPDSNAGIGLNVEVYDGKIIMRARDFYNGKWLEQIQKTFD